MYEYVQTMAEIAIFCTIRPCFYGIYLASNRMDGVVWTFLHPECYTAIQGTIPGKREKTL